MIYKLVVISDIHGSTDKLFSIIPIINSSDYLIFCGDGLTELLNMRGNILVPMVCVRGNNDYNPTVAEMASVSLGGTRVLVTHGHRQDVRRGTGGLMAAAKLKKCSLVFFGHTHTYCDYMQGGIHLVNPGALNSGSYALVLGDGKTFTCKHELIAPPPI